MTWLETKKTINNDREKSLIQIARLEKKINAAITHLTECIEHMWDLKNQIHAIERCVEKFGDTPALIRRRRVLNEEIEKVQAAIVDSGLEMKIARNQSKVEALKDGARPAPAKKISQEPIAAA